MHSISAGGAAMGRATRCNLFLFLKKGFPLLSLARRGQPIVVLEIGLVVCFWFRLNSLCFLCTYVVEKVLLIL